MSKDRYFFGKGRERGVGKTSNIRGCICTLTSSIVFAGDPISLTQNHHPHKRHFFGRVKDDTDYDPAKPYMPLTKIKLRLDRYPELNPGMVNDTEFIINVPIQCRFGDPIPLLIDKKVVFVPCPHLSLREKRFIACFVDKRNHVRWESDTRSDVHVPTADSV